MRGSHCQKRKWKVILHFETPSADSSLWPQTFLFSHTACFATNSRTETIASLTTCVVDYDLIEILPDIDKQLLQLIDVVNFRLIEPMLHFAAIFLINRVHIWVIRSQRAGEINADLFLVLEGWLFRALGEHEHCLAGTFATELTCNMQYCSFWVKSISRLTVVHYAPFICAPGSTNISPLCPSLDTPTDTICWKWNVSAADARVQHVSFSSSRHMDAIILMIFGVVT